MPRKSRGLKYTIEDMQQTAAERGGECLSETYVGILTKHRWRCGQGHEWEATPNDVRNNRQWCPDCAGTKRKTLADMHVLAAERGGKCLSTQYVNNRTALFWECDQGHQWEARPGNIYSGHWCPDCAGNVPYTLAELQAVAASKGGKCLAVSYTNNSAPIEWECKEGHRWTTAVMNVIAGNWCPACAGVARLTLDQMRQLAESRGGRCLSTEYKAITVKLEWQCAVGHRWKAAPGNVKLGTWCPTCSTGLGERICREAFEQLFGVPFMTGHPAWLRTPRGRWMHLDGYNEALGIAFEH